MLKYLIALSIAVAPATVKAADTVTNDGNEILQICQETDSFSIGLCIGYIRGVAATSDLWLISAKVPACRPNNVTVKQFRDVVVSYIERHPETRNYSSTALVISAGKEAWKCQ